MALDGPLAVDKDSQALLATSLSQAMVKSDDAGNTRLVKKGNNNTSRDDVAQGPRVSCWSAGPKAEDCHCAKPGARRVSWHKGEQPSRRQWGKVRLKVLDLSGWKCAKCGKSGRLEVDHIKPLEEGGALYDESNLQTLCRSCEHFAKTRGERRGRETDPEVQKWQRYLTDYRS